MKKLRGLFTKNLCPKQRQYETVRAIAMDGLSCAEAAARFGYGTQTVRNLKQMMLSGKLDFFLDVPTGPKGARTEERIIARILDLRR